MASPPDQPIEAPTVAVDRPCGGYWRPRRPVITLVPGTTERRPESKTKDVTIDISNPAELPSRRLR
jgi:hypothetical protein